MKLRLLSFDRKGAEQAVICMECGQITNSKDAFRHVQETGHNHWELILSKEDKVARQVAVVILGHKAWIESVSAAKETWWREDAIGVWLSFDEPVDSISGFAFNLPVRSYTVAEFLEAVRREGERIMEEMLKEDRIRRERRESRKQKQQELNQKVEEIKKLIGLE